MELIAALLHRPKVVFLDEPTIGLDIGAQKSIREFLLRYRKEHRPAMIITSHYMEDIEKLCERIVIIREGQFVYDGALDKVVGRHGGHKVIHAKFSTTTPIDAASLSSLGELIADNDNQAGTENRSTPDKESMSLRLKVSRDKVSEAAAVILRSYPVADFSIEEEDIADIIGSLLHEKKT